MKGRHLSIKKKSQDKSVFQACGLTTVGEQMEFISHIESLENIQGTTLHFSFFFVPFLCVQSNFAEGKHVFFVVLRIIKIKME